MEYCTYFKPYHQMGHEKSTDASNFVVKPTPETCKACGMCIKRCPMDAVQLKFSPKATNRWKKAVEVDQALCIGCGVCVVKCKAKSIVLQKRPEEELTEPPKNMRELVQINAMAVLEKKQKRES